MANYTILKYHHGWFLYMLDEPSPNAGENLWHFFCKQHSVDPVVQGILNSSWMTIPHESKLMPRFLTMVFVELTICICAITLR